MKLTLNERAPFTDFVRLTWQDLKTIGNGGTKQIATIPAGGACTLAGIINNVDIAGTSSLVLDVGTTIGDPDEFIDAWDADAATVNLPVFNTGESFVQSAGNTTIEAGIMPASATATALPVYIKVTDAAIDSITAGEVLIGLQILDILQYRK